MEKVVSISSPSGYKLNKVFGSYRVTIFIPNLNTKAFMKGDQKNKVTTKSWAFSGSSTLDIWIRS